MIAASFVFAAQDAISRHLASEYNVIMIVMIRYWFFGAFIIALARLQYGSIRALAHSQRPILQIIRGLLLMAEVCVMLTAFVYLGLIESLAVFTIYPLIVAALSGPILGEQVGWRRWGAIAIGFIGVAILLRPGFGVFSPYALIPLLSAVMFAFYGLLTRYVARFDGAMTSFFWTGIAGMFGISAIGPFYWQPMHPVDWGWMGILSITGVFGPLYVDQSLCLGTSQSGTALCLSASGVWRCFWCVCLWRNPKPVNHIWRRHNHYGGHLHNLSESNTRPRLAR